jgi:hypothetical protein
VDARHFVEDGWFGEGGYFHTDPLRVVERFWLDGDTLVYQATVSGPNVLVAPWTLSPRIVKRSTLPLEESPPCKDEDAQRLINDDHAIRGRSPAHPRTRAPAHRAPRTAHRAPRTVHRAPSCRSASIRCLGGTALYPRDNVAAGWTSN